MTDKINDKDQDRIERLKIASQAGKAAMTTVTCTEPAHPASEMMKLKHKCPPIKKETRPRSNSKSVLHESKISKKAGVKSRSCSRKTQHSEEKTSETDLVKSRLPKSQQTKRINTDGNIEMYDLETDELKKCYYREMLNQEETTLRARLLYEKKLLEHSKRKQRNLQIQQVQLDTSKIRAVDEVKLRLEEIIQKRILLEAIHDTLQKEHKKYDEIMKIEEMEAEAHQTKKQLMERVHSNIVKQLTSTHNTSRSTSTMENPTKLAVQQQKVSHKQNAGSARNKTVTIRKDLSIIDDSMSEEESSYFSDDICLSCGTRSGHCGCPRKTSSNSSSKGIVRTNTFHNIFEEKRYNIGGQSSKRITSKSVPTLYGLEVIREDIDLTDGWDIKRGTTDDVKCAEEHRAESAEERYSPSVDSALHSTTKQLVSDVLTQASEFVEKSVRKVPRDSLTIKSACKRNSIF